MLAALLIPAMTGAAGLGVEVSNWSLQQIELQTIADAAALAATAAIKAGANTQTALNAGADVAELNGASGTATRTWDGSNNVLTDNKIIVKRVTGIRNTGGFAYQAIVTRNVDMVITKLVSSLSTVTVSATGYAEVITSAVQGCIMITGSGGSALSMDNGASVDEAGCATQVNGGVTLSGGAKLNTGGLTAGGSVTVSNGASITGTVKANGGTFTDPYASDTKTQNALTAANSASGSALSASANTTYTFSPGSYSSMNFSNGATVTLNPGLYLVHGAINISGGSVTGTNVTIVFTDQMSVTNGATITLAAPTVSSGVGVPGVALTSKSSQDLALNSGTKFYLTGMIYYPSGHVEADNGFNTSSATCSVVVASSLTINGGAKFANACNSNSGVKPLNVPVGTTLVSLVK